MCLDPSSDPPDWGSCHCTKPIVCTYTRTVNASAACDSLSTVTTFWWPRSGWFGLGTEHDCAHPSVFAGCRSFVWYYTNFPLVPIQKVSWRYRVCDRWSSAFCWISNNALPPGPFSIFLIIVALAGLFLGALTVTVIFWDSSRYWEQAPEKKTGGKNQGLVFH